MRENKPLAKAQTGLKLIGSCESSNVLHDKNEPHFEDDKKMLHSLPLNDAFHKLQKLESKNYIYSSLLFTTIQVNPSSNL